MNSLAVTLTLMLASGSAEVSPTGLAPAPPESGTARFEAALARVDTEGPEALSTFGLEALPALVDVLGRGTSQAGAPLSEAQSAAVAATLARFELETGKEALSTALDALFAGEASLAERKGGLSVLGAVARREDFALLLRVAGVRDADATLDASLGPVLCRTVERLLARDPGAHDALVRVALHAPASVAAHLTRAVGVHAGEDAWRALDALLGYEPGLDRSVLAEIARVARTRPGTCPAELRERVASYLADADHQLVRDALQTLGWLDAQDLYPQLIALLESPEGSVRDAALASLQRLAGLSLPADPARWSTWLENEERWWKNDARALIAELVRGDQAEIVASLAALSRHRLRRDALVEAIAPLFQRESVAVRRAACLALADLGAASAIPLLRDFAQGLGEGPSLEAASAALAALGHPLPPRADAEAEAGASSQATLAEEGAPDEEGLAAPPNEARASDVVSSTLRR